MQEIIKYQNIDAKIRRLENELLGSANRKNATDMQQYLKDGQSRLMKLEQIANNLMEQYEKATKKYNEFLQKLDILTKNIESLNPEQISEVEKNIANLVSMSEMLENNIGLLANKIASANKEFELIMNNAKKAKHNLEIYKSNYNKEREKFEPEINKLKSELAGQKSKVDPKLLNIYNTKADGKLFPIFVSEVNDKCGGCRMEIPAGKLSDLKRKGVIECENCGRLIYKI